MNSIQLTTRLSVIAVIAGTLLSVALVTALSIVEEADARKKSSSSTSTKQTITQKNVISGSGGSSSNSGSNCIGGSCQVSNN